MSAPAVIENADFELITEFAQPDAKKRLSLGEALGASTAYNVCRNALGQVFLDPVKAISASETWLYQNPEALESVKQGLRDSAEDKTEDRPKTRPLSAAHLPATAAHSHAAEVPVHGHGRRAADHA